MTRVDQGGSRIVPSIAYEPALIRRSRGPVASRFFRFERPLNSHIGRRSATLQLCHAPEA
jgi:hypothetical protein